MRGRMRGRPGCRFAHPGYACGSPPPLHPQTLREIAAVHMLPEMIELAFKVDPHLAADIAPEPAEGVLLREIAPGIRIHHAVIEAPVQMRLRMAGRAVGRVAQIRIALHQAGEHVALDAHEAVRRFGALKLAY